MGKGKEWEHSNQIEMIEPPNMIFATQQPPPSMDDDMQLVWEMLTACSNMESELIKATKNILQKNRLACLKEVPYDTRMGKESEDSR
ncbi:uncharacterized protein G2W53_041251 [Senna tora]|uniref:Uncharacterized protein n=1 Tax=Senna tora TaxID=362788 RepID=A0A834SGT3_9FABA|nr:uncharacterized protein G2W53_041251 [Senna tora]